MRMGTHDHWMPLYPGDYLSATSHLTTQEHGAYMLLLMHSWRTGPLPDDDARLAAIARLPRAAWAKMAPTIRAFFAATPDGLTQARLERERARAAAKTEQRKAAGTASATARAAQRNANDRCPPVDAPLARNGRELHLHPDIERKEEISLAQKPVVPHRKPRASLATDPAGFAEFWQAYPRKEGKAAARKAYEIALRKADHAAIIRAVTQAAWNPDPRYIPHPASWLNGERWTDEAPSDAVLMALGIEGPDDTAPMLRIVK